ncbi:hypothetical protein PAMP_018070 [Pampus punctatissimus]
MAASVLLTDNTGLNFTVGGGGGGTGNVLAGNNNGLGPVGPAPWNRSVDRALDEASATGSLNLSGRKLKEFPRSAANHDLSDTTRAELFEVSAGQSAQPAGPHLPEPQDVSCNEIQTLPSQVGQLEALRDLNIRRNHLVTLPPELAALPLVRLDFSCNKVTSIPICYRRLTQLQTIVLDNNPLQTPPAQPTEELSELPLRVAEISREQRQRREDSRGGGGGPLLANGTHVELEQIDFIDSCVGEEEEEEGRSRAAAAGDRTSLSSQFMAYIERRITRERGGALSSGGVEMMRREAQLAALRYDEERQKTRSLQRDSVSSYTKHKAAQSPSKSSPDSEGEDRATLSPTANQSPSYPSSGGVASCRTASVRPESFLYRLGQKEEKKRGERTQSRCSTGDAAAAAAPQTQEEAPAAPALVGQDAELVEQLRKNIEARLKVSLPSDLGAALTDGVVLCHLANHVRPRSVPSIHVPSPAVSQLCLPLHILEERGLPQVAGTVGALLDLAPPRHPGTTTTTSSTTPGPSITM